MQFRRLIKPFVGLFALLAGVAQAETVLTVYTALEADQLKAYQARFEADNPGVHIRWVRDSTGVITARLLAERASPQADVVMGVAASSLLVLEKADMLQAYAPHGIEKITPRYRDDANPPNWVGMDVWGAVICFNTVEAQRLGLPKPASWQDLLKPVYKGHIVMPNPASSGTGYFDVTAWLKLYGEAGGWAYMDKLHANIAQYTHSGSKPCKQAAAGEFPIGISFEYRGAQLKAIGAPIDLIFPKEGLGWDVEATAVIKGGHHLAAAEQLADWSVSRNAAEQYEKNFAVLAYPGIAHPNALIPANYEQLLIAQDLRWSAANRDRILTEWSRRYDGKSEAQP